MDQHTFLSILCKRINLLIVWLLIDVVNTNKKQLKRSCLRFYDVCFFNSVNGIAIQINVMFWFYSYHVHKIYMHIQRMYFIVLKNYLLRIT